MTDATRVKVLNYLVRLHFAYLVAIPLLGLASWWFVRRSSLALMIIAGFAAIAAYYALLSEKYHLTTHLPSALYVVFLGPALIMISSLLGGGLWYFFIDATFVEVGGMCAGIVVGATVKGLNEKEYGMPVILYIFMGGFIAVWGWGVLRTHGQFRWYDNIWLVVALINVGYGHSRMFISGDLELNYGGTRAAARAGADWLPGPLQDQQGFSLILVFAILIVLSPVVLGFLSYIMRG